MNQVTDRTKTINKTIQGITAQKPSKAISNRLEESLNTTVVTSVGDVVLNHVVPTIEVCLNMVAGELERANRACTGIKSLEASVTALQSELSDLKTAIERKGNPQDEHSLLGAIGEDHVETTIEEVTVHCWNDN